MKSVKTEINNEIDGIFERFDSIRKSRGFTYQEIEDRSGIPKQTLFSLKRRGSISIKTLVVLAQTLKVSVDQLLGLAPLQLESRFDNKSLIEVPIYKLEYFKNTARAKIRYLSADIGEKTFGIAVNQVESNFPKGTILFFNPSVEPKSGCIVLVKLDKDDLRIRKINIEGHDVYFTHLKLNLSEKLENAEILGVCTLIMTDTYFSSFNE